MLVIYTGSLSKLLDQLGADTKGLDSDLMQNATPAEITPQQTAQLAGSLR
ncbi:MAG TPA: hypothetical protein VF791_07815 [Pyrinomonadaceae bacterium]